MTQDRLSTTLDAALTRRGFLQAGAVATGLLAVGCSSSGSPAAVGATGRPKVGGRVAVGTQLPYSTFDPQNATDALGVTRHLFDPLYETDVTAPDLAVREVLAVGPPKRLDDTTWQVTFRPTTFQDGSAMTADDVAFSIMRVAKPPKGQVSFYSQLLSYIGDVKAKGADTIEISTTVPVSDDVFRRRLASPCMGVVPRKVVEAQGPEKYGAKPIGSGPYQFVSYTENQGVEATRFAGYRGPMKGNFDRISWRILVDDAAREAALQTGQIDIAGSVPGRDIARLKGRGLTVASAPTSGAVYLTFNCAKAPWNDPRVRQALHFAIDKDSITKVAYFGNATPATSVLPDYHPDHINPDPVYKLDANRARSLLQQAGVQGKSLVLTVQQKSYMTDTGTIVRQNWQDVGLTVKVENATGTVLANRILGGGDFDVVISDGDPVGTSWDVPGALSSYWAPGTIRDKFLRWTDSTAQQFAKLLDSALTLPAAQVKPRYGQLQQILAETVPSYPLHYLGIANAINPRTVAGLTPQRWGFVDLRRAWHV
jgi:peptide/nickel transport system substrate-binding protein